MGASLARSRQLGMRRRPPRSTSRGDVRVLPSSLRISEKRPRLPPGRNSWSIAFSISAGSATTTCTSRLMAKSISSARAGSSGSASATCNVAVVRRHRHAADTSARRWPGIGLQQFGRKFDVRQRHDLGAQMVGHRPAGSSSSFMIPKSCRIWIDGRAAALEFGGDLLVLQVVNQPLFLDERQQWI